MEDTHRGEGEIVGEGVDANVGEGREGEEQRVVGKDEDERGERAPLLDSSLDVNPIQEGAAKTRRDFDVIQGSFDEGDKPTGEPHAREDLKGPLVVNRVKGLRGVKEEAETLFVELDSIEEKLVNIADVVHAILAPKKTLLRGFDESSDGRHNQVGHSGGQETVVSVGDANGAGVRDQTSELLRDEEKDPMIEPRRRRVAGAHGLEHVREEGASKHGVGPPSSKRDAVRTRGGVVGAFDGGHHSV